MLGRNSPPSLRGPGPSEMARSNLAGLVVVIRGSGRRCGLAAPGPPPASPLECRNDGIVWLLARLYGSRLIIIREVQRPFTSNKSKLVSLGSEAWGDLRSQSDPTNCPRPSGGREANLRAIPKWERNVASSKELGTIRLGSPRKWNGRAASRAAKATAGADVEMCRTSHSRR